MGYGQHDHYTITIKKNLLLLKTEDFTNKFETEDKRIALDILMV